MARNTMVFLLVILLGAIDADAALDPKGLGFDELVYVKRKPYSSNHYYTDINNGTSADRFIAENAICVLNLKTGEERNVVTAAQLPGGVGFIGKISLSFDAKKVVFDFREHAQAGFRVWEVGIDGRGLRQISFPAEDETAKIERWGKANWHTDDVHPAYLPDGGIIFSSTRAERTVLCGGSAALVSPILHRMDADGRNIKQLSQSLVSEFCPVVLDDGRVMYHRWEYIDKGARVCKTIWSMNPDGTRPQEMYGVGDDTTTVYMYPQPIPGDPNRLVCVGTCHFPQGGCLGAIMLIDLQHNSQKRGLDPDEVGYTKFDPASPVTNITPTVFTERRTEPGWHFKTAGGDFVHDKNGQSGHLYTNPWPVSENQFLVSYKVNPKDHYKNVPNAYALYLIDTKGAHQLVRQDPDLSLWHPTPLVARDAPPVLETHRDPKLMASNEAVVSLTDIYQGMAGVEPGEVKWLRINEAIPRYWSTGRRWSKGLSSSRWKGALWPRAQWGVVPVEEDGSAHFKVPANRNVFFQALDKDFREVQRERTYVNYQPGEVRACVGCHGRSHAAAYSTEPKMSMALRRAPSTPQPQPCDLEANGGDGKAKQVIHYPTDIQPIWDAKCILCHGAKAPDGDLNLTGAVTEMYSASYEQLASKELAGPIVSEFQSFGKGDQGNYNGAELPPKSMGSHNSPLMSILTDSGHAKNAMDDHTTMLTEHELMKVARWVDANYQFYGGYYGRQHSNWVNADPKVPEYDPADFRRRPSFEEATSHRAPEWHR